MVILAITVTALRVALPRLNQYQSEIETWVSQSTGITFQISDVQGYWRNTHPFVSLQGLQAVLPDREKTIIALDEVEIEIDLIQTLLHLTPTVSTLRIDGLNLDISQIQWLPEQGDSSKPAEKSLTNSPDVLLDVQQVLLHQLTNFKLKNSQVSYQTFTGDVKVIDIESLNWRNENNRHRGNGVVSIAGTNINSLSVQADFANTDDLSKLTGEFFVAADSLQVTPWLTRYLKDEIGIEKGTVSFNSWLSFEEGEPVDAYVEVLPSELVWSKHKGHMLTVEEGILVLKPQADGWQVNAHGLRVRTDETPWPELDWVLKWQPDEWWLNVSQLDVATLTPIGHWFPKAYDFSVWLEEVELGGRVEDIRVNMKETLESLHFSAQLNGGKMNQWELLPEVHHLQASITGNTQQVKAKLNLVDDVLPYGDVFQAPLQIKQGQVDLVFEHDELGWSLWADKVTAATPDLQVLGAFKLDFPYQGNAFLSFYAEADAFNASQTWRYLPTLALGQELTDYLSTAIQGGRAETAKLLWYGELANFPYANNDGMFQALVNLKQAQFSFDTAWPVIKDLQLDLLFQNEEMHLDSRSAKLMDVKASRITGRIPYLGDGGHIEIEAKAKAKGSDVRDYMMATPLIDSVGAALTAIDVGGAVKSEFQLHIPFDGSDARAWGWADLNNNHIKIKAPSMTLEKATGRIEFDDDVVQASGLSAQLLDQPIALDFKGESQDKKYIVAIDTLGDWDVDPLVPYLGESWLKRVQGHAPWSMGINLQLDDIGFTYQIDGDANIQYVASQYPAPLTKLAGKKARAQLQASGNQETISGRLQLPGVKYQAEIDISGDKPVLEATNLVVGKGAFKVSPVVGHSASIRTKQFDLDEWLSLFLGPVTGPKPLVSELDMPELPMPTRVDLSTPTLVLGGIDWHDVDFQARKKSLGWRMNLESAEAKGQANYLEPYDLTVALDRLQVYVPSLDEVSDEQPAKEVVAAPKELVSALDRTLHQALPNLTLAINDFWFQGYKVGQVNVDFQRQGDRLVWDQVSLRSGANKFDGTGWWKLTDTENRSHFEFNMSGDNNTDLMERFGITSGIQKAPFEMSSKLDWQGSPWDPQVETLSGQMSSKLGSGIISDVSGAARLLGLFSLDSILRKMKLDFTGVFDKGMAFNSISGSGNIKDGVFVTNDIDMDAAAGRMKIRGLADLTTQQVDAEVEFTPDLTSGIPVISAFAVAPQTAILVFAVTTALSPVIDVITQVRYEVKGPLDAPQVNELSRSKGQYKLPKDK